jgi:hypothetical protein
VFSDSKRQNGEHTACVEPVGADLSESGIDSSTETISELDLRTTMYSSVPSCLAWSCQTHAGSKYMAPREKSALHAQYSVSV